MHEEEWNYTKCIGEHSWKKTFGRPRLKRITWLLD
jgi:hypothetical protein